MDKNQIRETIARRAALELQDGYVVNLGIGLPTLLTNYIPEGVNVTIDAENGMLGVGPTPESGTEDSNFFDAGGAYVTPLEGCSIFDSATSFGIIRGGHVDVCVLGALQVDEKGNLANWMIPGKLTPGMGGAKVIIVMEHTAKGNHKIMKNCSLPLTAAGQVNMIITEMGVMVITDKGIELTEINPEFTVEEVQVATEAKLIISKNLKNMC